MILWWWTKPQFTCPIWVLFLNEYAHGICYLFCTDVLQIKYKMIFKKWYIYSLFLPHPSFPLPLPSAPQTMQRTLRSLKQGLRVQTLALALPGFVTVNRCVIMLVCFLWAKVADCNAYPWDNYKDSMRWCTGTAWGHKCSVTLGLGIRCATVTVGQSVGFDSLSPGKGVVRVPGASACSAREVLAVWQDFSGGTFYFFGVSPIGRVYLRLPLATSFPSFPSSEICLRVWDSSQLAARFPCLLDPEFLSPHV